MGSKPFSNFTSRVSSLCIKATISMLLFASVSLSFPSGLKSTLGCPQRVFPRAPKLQDSLFIRDQWLERLLEIPISAKVLLDCVSMEAAHVRMLGDPGSPLYFCGVQRDQEGGANTRLKGAGNIGTVSGFPDIVPPWIWNSWEQMDSSHLVFSGLGRLSG